jgi:hypothetical protein
MRQKRNQAQGKAAEDEKHRIWQVDPSRDNIKRCDDHQEKADELDFGHIATKEDFSSLGKRRTERNGSIGGHRNALGQRPSESRASAPSL